MIRLGVNKRHLGTKKEDPEWIPFGKCISQVHYNLTNIRSQQGGTEMGSKKPVVVQITEEKLMNIMEMASSTAVEKWERERERCVNAAFKKQHKDMINETKNALENYRRRKKDISEPLSQEEINYTRMEFLSDLMNPGEIKKTRDLAEAATIEAENRYYVKRVDRAMKFFKEECEESDKPEDMRKYRVVNFMYIDEEKLSVAEIAERESITERTVYNDVRDACEVLAVYIAMKPIQSLPAARNVSKTFQ